MEKTTKIVTASIVLILLVSIAVSVLAWNFRTYDSQFSDQKCSRKGSYCIYNDIPAGMMFTKPSQSLDGVHEFAGDLNDYMINANSPDYGKEVVDYEYERIPTPKEFRIWSLDDYECISTGEEPEVIEYFFEFQSRSGRYSPYKRRALVCGDEYLIQEEKYGSKLYGPYDMPE